MLLKWQKQHCTSKFLLELSLGCPKCGSERALRLNKTAGTWFWGCTSYNTEKLCHYTADVLSTEVNFFKPSPPSGGQITQPNSMPGRPTSFPPTKKHCNSFFHK